MTTATQDKVFGFLSSKELLWLKEEGRVLGSGSFGTVYSYKTANNQNNAVKLILNKKKGKINITSDTLVEVSTILALPTHPNIIKLYDIFVRGDYFGLVLEEAQSDLQKVLDQKHLPDGGELTLKIRKNLCYQLLRGVSVIMNYSIVNRDYKPSNLLITQKEAGCIKLIITDFGISVDGKCYRDTSRSSSGTPVFMAPELFLGGKASDASDMWSVCLTIYNILLGSKLILGKEGKANVIYEILALFGKDPTEHWEDIEEDLPKYNSIVGDEHISMLDDYNKLETRIDQDIFSNRKTGHADKDNVLEYEQEELETKEFILSIINLHPDDRSTPDELMDSEYLLDVGKQVESTNCLKTTLSLNDSCQELFDEREFPPIPVYTRKYENSIRRAQIILTLMEQKKLFGFTNRCIMLTIALADRYLARTAIDAEEKLKEIRKTKEVETSIDTSTYSIAFACSLYLAFNFLRLGGNFDIIHVQDMVKSRYISEKDIYSKNIQILASIGFKLHNSTAYDRLLNYLSPYNDKTQNASIIYCYLLHHDYRLLSKYDTELLALMSLYLGALYSGEKVRENETIDEEYNTLATTTISTLITKLWMNNETNKLNRRLLKPIVSGVFTADVVILGTKELDVS